jgi:hypothetical protein
MQLKAWNLIILLYNYRWNGEIWLKWWFISLRAYNKSYNYSFITTTPSVPEYSFLDFFKVEPFQLWPTITLKIIYFKYKRLYILIVRFIQIYRYHFYVISIYDCFVIHGQSWKFWLWKSLNEAIVWDGGSNNYRCQLYMVTMNLLKQL